MMLMFAAVLSLLFQTDSAVRADKPVRMTGWVSDGHCTTEHMKEGGAACVRKCIAGATHVNPEWTRNDKVGSVKIVKLLSPKK
jgi:hypothetical protein